MSEWKKVKLKDCCHSISDGDHLPPPKSNSGVPFVTIANIDATNHIDFGNTMFVPLEYYNNLNDIRKAKCNDILYSVVGSFGKPVLVKENIPFAFQRHIAILRPNNEIADSRFLYYVMLTRDFFMQADTVAIGAAQRTISLTALRNMEVKLPSMETQHRIASILSRYDSLIENYQKQIKLLGEAAQRLYKEWFIDLHFPGHENTNIIDGVPEGWEKKKVGDITPIITGKKDANFGTPDGEYPFFTCSQEPIKAPSFSFDCAAVLLAGNGDFNVKLYRGRFEAYQRTYVLSPYIDSHLYLLFYTISANMTKLAAGSSGSTIKFLTKGMIDGINLNVPNDEILRSFNKKVEPIQSSRESLQSQLRLLTEARDRLLPKLMSGEITI